MRVRAAAAGLARGRAGGRGAGALARAVRHSPAAAAWGAGGFAGSAELRRLVEQMVQYAGQLGEHALEIAPPYLSDVQAAERGLHEFAEAIGEGLDEVLAARRFAITGDRRALEDTIL